MFAKTNDFPDRLSPMLVKELRQGMRARAFVSVFLCLQIFLALILLSAGAGATSERSGSVVSSVIFLFFSLAVLIVQPLRGVAALSSEVKGNTIDMMVLTRLSAWRIVLGKWVALVSQSALILSTIIPYLILRYFFGGMNLLGEMVLLALVFITSTALTALTVGLSGSSSVVLRALIPIFGTPLLLWTVFMMAFGFNGLSNLVETCTLSTPEDRIGIAVYLVAIIYLGGSSLSLGASLVAPAAENHSTIRRLVALSLTLAVAGISAAGKITEDFLPLILSLIILPAIAIALTESTQLVPTVCKPFVRRGLPGKAAGFFLYPGWPSGVFFTAVLILTGALAFALMDQPGRIDEEVAIVSLSLLGGFLFPALVVSFIRKGESQKISTFLLLVIASSVFAMVLTAIAESMSSSAFLWLFIWNPFALLSMLSTNDFSNATILTAAIGVNLILLGLLFVKAIIAFKGYREIIAQAESGIESPEPLATPAES